MKGFSSRWMLLLATLGMAIGTGNLWRFPRILAQNGGGTFLIPWIIFLFAWSIPLLMVEFSLGRATGKGPFAAFAKQFGGRTAWRGGFVAVCTLAILFYYSVVSGWTVRYFWLAMSGGSAELTPANAEASFIQFTESSAPVFYHLLAMGLSCLVVVRGVTGGIERACKILVPSLFAVLLIAAARGLTLDGAEEGLAFLFHVEWARLGEAKIWLEALSQSAWSTGAGWGLMVCYAIYASESSRTARECVATGVGNNLASLLAALAIIPAAFALASVADPSINPESLVGTAGPANTGITFIWMPVLFREMPWGGQVLNFLFFMALAFAALSSMIAMVELGARTLEDFGLSRSRAVFWTFLVGALAGTPSALSLDVFSNQDWVWGVGLIVSGGLIALTVVGYGVERYWKEAVAGPENSTESGAAFRFAITVLIPIQFIGLLAWWFWQAWGWTAGGEGEVKETAARWAEWLDPFTLHSVGTCLVQWAVVIVLLKLFNGWLVRRTGSEP